MKIVFIDIIQGTIFISIYNKPKGLKVAKEDQRLLGLMVDWLTG